MKKLLLLSMLFMTTFISCDNQTKTKDKTNEVTKTEVVRTPCDCYAIVNGEDPIPHMLEECQELYNDDDYDDCVETKWKLDYFVDEFNDKTDESYIKYVDFDGDFTNSATRNSRLIAQILVQKYPEYYETTDTLPMFRFDLLEYGDNTVGKSIGGAKYTLIVKIDGSKQEFDLYAGETSLYLKWSIYTSKDLKKYESKKNLKVWSKEAQDFYSLLLNEKNEIKCLIIIDGKYSKEKYNFTINPMGFDRIIKKIYSN